MSLSFYAAADHLPSQSNTGLASGDGGWDSIVNTVVALGLGGRNVFRTSGSVIPTKQIPASGRVTLGMRHASNSAPLSSAASDIIVLANASGALLSLYRNSAGNAEIRRGATVLAEAPVRLDEQWRYIEMDVVLHATEGACVLRADGVEVLTLSGINTAAVALGTGCTMVQVRGTSGNVTQFTDCYLRNDGLLHGPILLRPLRPISTIEGGWTRNGGTANHDRVSEIPTDQNTTYVETNVLGKADEYEMEDLPPDVNSIIAVVAITVATAPNGGAPLIDLRLKDSAGSITPSDPAAVGVSGYQTQQRVFTRAPDGSAWSTAKVNDLRFRIEAT